MEWLDRTRLLLGDQKLEKLKNSHVLVVGLGGVGAYAAELICRAGVGKMTIVDMDVVDVTNRNRQLPALISNTGKPKAAIMEERLLDINPELELHAVKEFIRDEKTKELLRSAPFDYVVDAIDTLSPKVFLMYECLQMKLNLISSMGAGGKTDPSKVIVTDISETYNCRLSRVIRKRLSRMGVKSGIQVVFSPEETDPNAVREEESQNRKSSVGTISYMPPLFGCVAASVVIRSLVG